MKNTKVTLANLCAQWFSSYTQILCQDGAQSSQKWCQHNFHVGLEVDDLEIPLTTVSSNSNDFDKIAEKNNLSKGILVYFGWF